MTIEYDVEVDGRFIASVSTLPGCMVYGRNRQEVRRKVITLALVIVTDLVYRKMLNPTSITFEEKP